MEEIVVMAPSSIGVHIETTRPCVIRYVTAHESRSDGHTLRAAVELSLRGCETTISRRTGAVLNWLERQSAVPCGKQLADAATSRRTFYRLWREDIPGLSPAHLLRRIGAHFAVELLDAGIAEGEAAARCGFPSISRMRAAVAYFANGS